MKKPNENAEVTKEIAVENARVLTYKDTTTVLFNMIVNGVTIYGCKVVEGKNGDFVSFPQTKDKNGKYWNVAYVKLTEQETKEVLEMVEVMINK